MVTLWTCEVDGDRSGAVRDRPVGAGGRFERTAPGFQGAVLLREGAKLLAVSCWDGRGPAEAALEPLLDRVASSELDALLAKPLSCRFRTL